MKKTRNTKKSLILSALSLVLCIAMLLGTTYAWFTDSVTSGVNTITAGNLDIDVEYKNDNVNSWKNLENSDSVFSKGLWEPGHTEFVTLKITNKGTLALKYRMNVSPISEIGGINAEGTAFKLSDYLVFGTTTPSDTEAVYTRDSARAAVGTTTGLNQSALSKYETMLPGDVDYISLVVYMPESVGNEANYKTGTTPPEIDLGIKFIATQLASEDDSFGNDYDDNIDYNALDNALIYNFFPQVDVTGQLEIKGTEVKKGSTAGTETSVTKLTDTTSKVVLASPDTIENNTAAKLTTVLNKGTLNDSETGSLTLKVVKDDTANANFQATNTDDIDTDKQDSTTYQVTVETEGVVAIPETEGKAKFKVDLFIGKNRKNVEMFHSGVAMTKATTEAPETYTYDSATGYVNMYVDNFSPFTAVYDLPVASIGTTIYYTIDSAITASNASDTIVLLTDLTLDASVQVTKSANINGMGHTLTLNYTGANYTGKSIFNANNGVNEGVVLGLSVKNLNMKMAGTVKNGYGIVAGKGESTFNIAFDNCSFENMYCGVLANGCGSTVAPNIFVKNSNFKDVCYGISYYMPDYLGNVTFTNNNMRGETAIQELFTAEGSVKAATVLVDDGTYSVDPAEFVKTGYKATKGEDDIWTVIAKVVPVPVNNVFTANTNEQLADVIDEINTNPAYTEGDYTIQLGSGTIGGVWDETRQGWIANVYVIKQFPDWNGYYGNAATENNMATPPADHSRITLVGSDTARTNFKGAIMVVGFGYSNGGSYNITADKVRTEIKNLDFDYTDVIGVNEAEGKQNFGNSTDGYMPIIGCGASANLYITNCNFKGISRIKLGLAQGNQSAANLYDANGKVQEVKGYSFNPVVTGCKFTDCDTCIDGYFSGSEFASISGIVAKNCQAFINAQNGNINEIPVENCTVECDNYLIRTSDGSAKFRFLNCDINVKTIDLTNDEKYGLVVFRKAGSHSIVLDSCKITGSTEVHSFNNANTNSVLTLKDTNFSDGTTLTPLTASGITQTGNCTCTIQDYVAP